MKKPRSNCPGGGGGGNNIFFYGNKTSEISRAGGSTKKNKRKKQSRGLRKIPGCGWGGGGGKSKFFSWASENRSLVVRWGSEISLSGLVSDNFQSKTISKLQTAR